MPSAFDDDLPPWRSRLVPPPMRAWLRARLATDGGARILKTLLGEPRIFEWLHSVAVVQNPDLRALVPPIPPEALRGVVAQRDVAEFLWTGLLDVDLLLGIYEEHRDASAPPRPRVLDFGCGCGRLLRFLVGHGDLFELHGCDVAEKHVAWCRAHLPGVAFATNAPAPPLGYPDAHFDLVWTLSVFTHLDAPAAATWRAELARILRPGGVLLATLHGPTALDRVVNEPEVRDLFRLDAAAATALRTRTRRDGFAFLPYDADQLAAAEAGPGYGAAFHAPEDVARRWPSAALELVAYLPGKLRGWQDVVVLRWR
ncbi:MAG TPA: class I SAM-dependent methyltransferase [Planctomycetota bacterium]|nr:class I SAM-dependent methyltransferase [Planctomycetota bacterium]